MCVCCQEWAFSVGFVYMCLAYHSLSNLSVFCRDTISAELARYWFLLVFHLHLSYIATETVFMHALDLTSEHFVDTFSCVSFLFWVAVRPLLQTVDGCFCLDFCVLLVLFCFCLLFFFCFHLLCFLWIKMCVHVYVCTHACVCVCVCVCVWEREREKESLKSLCVCVCVCVLCLYLPVLMIAVCRFFCVCIVYAFCGQICLFQVYKCLLYFVCVLKTLYF